MQCLGVNGKETSEKTGLEIFPALSWPKTFFPKKKGLPSIPFSEKSNLKEYLLLKTSSSKSSALKEKGNFFQIVQAENVIVFPHKETLIWSFQEFLSWEKIALMNWN